MIVVRHAANGTMPGLFKKRIESRMGRSHAAAVAACGSRNDVSASWETATANR